jgi:hypothetical protein
MKILKPSELTSFPGFKELSPDEVAEAYALARGAFTAEDLQRYTELDQGVSAAEVLRELEEAQKQFEQKPQ